MVIMFSHFRAKNLSERWQGGHYDFFIFVMLSLHATDNEKIKELILHD